MKNVLPKESQMYEQPFKATKDHAWPLRQKKKLFQFAAVIPLCVIPSNINTPNTATVTN